MSIIYFSHGGGPLPILKDPSHAKMIEFMKNLPSKIRRPEAIVVFSAHWEENVVTIQSGGQPAILYDYYGFPEAAYHIQYPCQGNPSLAGEISELLTRHGVQNRLDEQRPYDHGSYIPLIMMYPDADIPVLQISLHHNLQPLTHLKIGQALRPLLAKNILFIGSGFSYHNLMRFDFSVRIKDDPLNNEFQDNLIDICSKDKDEADRWRQLVNWQEIPGARYCHPREEHLLPLMVCVGLSAAQAEKVFDDYILGKRATAFLWA